MFTRIKFTWVTLVPLVLAGVLGSGCKPAAAPAQRPPPQLPEVAVVVVTPQAVSLSTELPGRTAAYLEAEVRPQVSGIIQSRHFEEGQDVSAGDLLYQLDPARYQAIHAQAQAALAIAEAQLPALRARVERYTNALAERAVSQQDYDEAVAALGQGEATIQLRAAEVESARIDLSYTQITAPISGRIGKSYVTVGALVTANQPTALATIRQFDPIYVDVTQSSAELLRMKREFESGALRASGDQRVVRLFLEDRTPYALEGKLQFRDITVEPTTGSYTLRIVFPNPEHLLLPGMFVWASVQEGTAEQAILVPQEGVSRNPKGEAIALIVDETDTVQQRKLTLNRALGNQWLVSDGLSAGDRLIVEGLINARPGNPVRVVPFASAAGQRGAGAAHSPASRPN
jgi:membrane fusion protein (multidrug efflux system)